MSQVTRVTIVEDECISCEQCVTECEAVFEMDDDKAKVRNNDPAFLSEQSADILSAVESCPSEAIKIETA